MKAVTEIPRSTTAGHSNRPKKRPVPDSTTKFEAPDFDGWKELAALTVDPTYG